MADPTPMGDPKQLRIIRHGPKTWNKWRKQNPNIEINLSYTLLSGEDLTGANLTEAKLIGTDLTGANFTAGANFTGADLTRAHLTRAYLSEANLSEANLSEAKLTGAYLSNTNLSEANLSGLNLSGANLSNTNLSGANLSTTQALHTNFNNANLTGACIQDWNINHQTNLNNVSCDYIFLKQKWNDKTEKYDFSERRPHDPNKNFKPGEFTTLFQKALETVDLIFLDGIDWTTFLTAFQKLQTEDNSGELSIQAIENKQDGAFVIRVNTPANTNKETIETSFWSKYQPLLEAKNKEIKLLSQQTEFYSEQIQFIRQDNTRLLGIIETMAEQEPSKYDLRGANIGNLANQVKDNARQQANQYNYAPKQKQALAEAAAEIQKLLKQLEQTKPTATIEDKKAFVTLGTTPTTRERALSALKSGGKAAFEEFLNNPYLNTAIAIIEGWQNP